MRHYWFPLFWALSILFLCTIGTEDLPSVGFLDLLSFDKFVHAAMFGVLNLTLLVACRRQLRFHVVRKKAIIIALVFSLAYGTIIEVLQFFLATGRSAEYQDIVANTVGCIIGLYLFRLIYGKELFRAS